MKPQPLQHGDVVQLAPDTVRNKAFAGCFMLITEPKPWGAQGFVQALGPNPDTSGGAAYYRARWEEMDYVGIAAWAPIPDTDDEVSTEEKTA